MLDLSTSGPEEALRVVLAGVLALWITWWGLVLLVALADRRLAARLAPPLLRALLVTGAVVSVQSPARATPGGVETLHGLALPDRPLTAAPEPKRPPPEPSAHVVAPGDSLWSIVRSRSPGADDASVGAAVDRWYRANRDVIGDDPDLIQLGQRLDPPGAP
ncbi:LysM peptidoglycan-binding domain-containing protein [Aeromicrobium sp. Marseille-Q0843]|uniref:LysM peptidoglycan-binding domain-containing protein n=1 Tax=Aeromicrobium phoceense TaxID=2754045 RepID=A0A838XN18_9ACTN|nr:LysM domain-containing protein [Aeromicrobium phoceense]MBA4608364.1 LysM peptidoglycan-binding domain-containing protein [Aeromicrobium phoceense]